MRVCLLLLAYSICPAHTPVLQDKEKVAEYKAAIKEKLTREGPNTDVASITSFVEPTVSDSKFYVTPTFPVINDALPFDALLSGNDYVSISRMFASYNSSLLEPP